MRVRRTRSGVTPLQLGPRLAVYLLAPIKDWRGGAHIGEGDLEAAPSVCIPLTYAVVCRSLRECARRPFPLDSAPAASSGLLQRRSMSWAIPLVPGNKRRGRCNLPRHSARGTSKCAVQAGVHRPIQGRRRSGYVRIDARHHEGAPYVREEPLTCVAVCFARLVRS